MGLSFLSEPIGVKPERSSNGFSFRKRQAKEQTTLETTSVVQTCLDIIYLIKKMQTTGVLISLAAKQRRMTTPRNVIVLNGSAPCLPPVTLYSKTAAVQ